jgi:probable addiction module antidote protein
MKLNLKKKLENQMTTKKIASSSFDIAEYLNDEIVIAEYLSAAAADENPDVLIAALGDVAKARGMAEISRKSGLGRESLYKSLVVGAKPRHETIQSVLYAIGMQFAVVPVGETAPIHRDPVAKRSLQRKARRKLDLATA